MTVLAVGTWVQIISLLAAITVCYQLSAGFSAVSATGIEAPFVLICFLGVMDALGKVINGVAVFRDWILLSTARQIRSSAQ